MLITIVIYGDADPLTRQLELRPPATVADALQLAEEEPQGRLLLLNGLHTDPDASLSDGDRLCVFFPIAGGSLI